MVQLSAWMAWVGQSVKYHPNLCQTVLQITFTRIMRIRNIYYNYMHMTLKLNIEYS